MKKKEKSNNIIKAKKIAINCLRKNYSKKGIKAWTKHFTDIWTRDSTFASLWALDIWDTDIVKKNIETILINISTKWQVPLRYWVWVFSQILKFFHINSWKNKARFMQDKFFSVPQDQNSLIIILINKYINITNDIKFIKQFKPQIKKIYNWNESQCKEWLLYWGNYATWQDSIKKPWYTLINNIFFIESIISFWNIQKKLWINNFEYDKYIKKYEKTKDLLIKKFWNNEKWYFNAWIHKWKPYDYFSVDWNIFAIYFNITSKKQEKNIINFLLSKEHTLLKPFWSKTNFPYYSFNDTCRRYFPFWMSDYHNNSMIWLWLWSLVTIVLNKTWMKKEAKKEFKKIANVIIKYKNIYEVYEQTGKPVKRIFYSSEKNFAWSSSFFILAYNEIFKI